MKVIVKLKIYYFKMKQIKLKKKINQENFQFL